MIPWMREKFAERRARWIASRKRNEGNNSSSSTSSSHKGGEKQNSTSKSRGDEVRSSPAAAQSSGSGSRENLRKVKILSPLGKMIILQMDASTKILELKRQAIDRFTDDSGALPFSAGDVRHLLGKYRLVRPDSMEPLTESLSLGESDVHDNELFLLAVKRTTNFCDLNNARGPTNQEITLATRNLMTTESKPPRVDINELVLQSDLQFDVRKVLISLAQASAYVIGSGPYASRLIYMLKQKLINRRKHQNDSLQCLVDMGFAREKAAYALKLKNGIYSAALDWLIEHQNDSSTSLVDDCSPVGTTTPSRQTIPNSTVENIEALLEIVRIYGQREIAPPQETVIALVTMGFDEKKVREALKMTRNNQAAACEWLCGNRSVSLTELREGLSPESPILKAMMESPQVQVSLSNPKIFIAYLSMLDNQNALSMWLGDSDTSSVLSHILRKYHEEKHILGINQFNSVR